MGAFSALMFYGIGQHFHGLEKGVGFLGTGLKASQFAAKVMTHSIAGGIMSKLQGGKFGHGFASAGVTQLMSPAINKVNASNEGFSGARVAVAAMVGGTTSALTGGKFANGAVTAAFSRAFNDEMSAKAQRGGALRDKLQVAIDENDNRIHELSNEELTLIAQHDFEYLRSDESLMPDKFKEMGFFDFLKAAEERGDGTFYVFNKSVFRITDGPFKGVHRGTDMNYYYFGMLAKETGRSLSYVEFLSDAWNAKDFYKKGFDNIEYQQMKAVKPWLKYGYDFESVPE